MIHIKTTNQWKFSGKKNLKTRLFLKYWVNQYDWLITNSLTQPVENMKSFDKDYIRECLILLDNIKNDVKNLKRRRA